MQLDVKALGFIAQALTHYIAWHAEQLARPDLDEDALSDLENDTYYLKSLLESFELEKQRLTASGPPSRA